jgi:hypothetical protein
MVFRTRSRERKLTSLGAAAACVALAALAFAAPASAAITGTNDPGVLSQALAVDPPTGSSIDPAYPGPDFPNGISDTPLGGFPLNGNNFTILTTGDVQLADDPNDDGGSGFAHDTEGFGQAFDYTVLRTDVNVPPPNNCLVFDFRFLSEEFPEYVNAGFNDAFVAQLNTHSLNVTGSTIDAPGDFAAGPGDRVSVDNQGPSGMSAPEAAGTTYDGATEMQTAKALVNPGPNSVFFSIFDAGDHILDTGVFIDNLRFTQEPPSTCKTPFESSLNFPGEPLMQCKGTKCEPLSVTCNLPVAPQVPCTPFILVIVDFQVGQSRGAETSKKKPKTVQFASANPTIPPGQTAEVPLTTTPEGKKMLKKVQKGKVKKKATAHINVSNSSNTATDTTDATLKVKKKKKK